MPSPAVPSLVVMYGLDALIFLLALGAALSATGERRQRLRPRWRLLAPGLLGFLGTLILLAYPEIRDLVDPQMWSIGLVGLAIGALRGWALRIDSDLAFGVVRLRSHNDAAWVAWAMALFAAIQGAIETGLDAENPWEKTAELLMLLTSGYLLGRSAIAWLRARSGHHVELRQE